MIPNITDPLGRYWNQPKDIREAPMDETHVLLTPHQFRELAEYSTTMPSGVYPGKCWKREQLEVTPKGWRPTGIWALGWYGESEKGPGWCSNNWRRIEVVE
ncbi:hypothetical protein Sa4125_25510 [Aureimonas sp. SA4125]|uniref:hypothetical protein n=1 Tax=Aureimonas sp. SA4125 TaxID=2826993 RepID=UPI001CC7FCE3|nr:hypothetical protein [Aureimonas sp. SA4125]BDA85009.1 hypothetical protein Sa4125_25510 [Aureimonas sp. SA4125]